MDLHQFTECSEYITYAICPLTSLNSTSFILKFVFWVSLADGVGRVPAKGGGSNKNRKIDLKSNLMSFENIIRHSGKGVSHNLS